MNSADLMGRRPSHGDRVCALEGALRGPDPSFEPGRSAPASHADGMRAPGDEPLIAEKARRDE